MKKTMESYFEPQKDVAQNGKKRKHDEMVVVLNASMGNSNVEGNDEANADTLIVASIQSKKKAS